MRDNRVEQNVREDKKALKTFIPILIVAAIIGAVIGVVSALADEMPLLQFGAGLQDTIAAGSPFFLIGFNTVVLIVTIYIIVTARKSFQAWDGEDEAYVDAIEQKVSIGLTIGSIDLILSFFLFGAGFYGGIKGMNRGSMEWFPYMLNVAGLCYSLFVNVIGQNRMVNLVKEINPEKRGSVYDTKFKKVWLDSCDEAEQQMIYKAAYKSYAVLQTMYPFLWLLCVFGIFWWDFNLIPLLMVSIIWMVQVVVYSVESMRLSKHN